METVTKFTESAAYSILVQIGFRASTFVLNAVLLRFISKELLGIVNVRLMLLYSTLVFFAGEPFRKACLSRTDDPNFNWKKSINLLWLCPILAASLSVLLSFYWSHFLSRPLITEAQFYDSAVVLFALSAFIEKLAEPLFVFGQALMLVKFKAIAEATLHAIRQLLFVFLTIFWPQNSLLNFGRAMVISSACYALMYYAYFYWMLKRNNLRGSDMIACSVTKFRDLFPHFHLGLDRVTLRLVLAFFRHSFVKQMLTEGERYVMTFFNVLSFANQGIYDVVANLGSLVARIIFAPLEESGYVYFSVTIKRGVQLDKQEREDILLATRVFKALLKLVSLIGCIILVFGLTYSFLALRLYGGSELSSGPGPSLLRFYSCYVVLLAINGITECLTFAIMPESQVDRHQRWLVVFCFGFLCAALLFTELSGSVGFIMANCLNMLCRIIYSCVFIHRFYFVAVDRRNELHHRLKTELADSPLKSMIPNSSVLISLCSSLAVTFLSNIIFCCDGAFNTLAHLSVGCVCLLATVFRIYYTELEFVDFVTKYILKRKQ